MLGSCRQIQTRLTLKVREDPYRTAYIFQEVWKKSLDAGRKEKNFPFPFPSLPGIPYLGKINVTLLNLVEVETMPLASTGTAGGDLTHWNFATGVWTTTAFCLYNPHCSQAPSIPLLFYVANQGRRVSIFTHSWFFLCASSPSLAAAAQITN